MSNIDNLPRISPSMSLAELKDECRVRQLRLSGSKTDLLERLLVGSVHLGKVPEFAFVEQVKRLMETEKSGFYARDSMLFQEKQQQAALDLGVLKNKRKLTHKVSLPFHMCMLAHTKDLLDAKNKPRIITAACLLCKTVGECLYTCENCNYDVCTVHRS